MASAPSGLPHPQWAEDAAAEARRAQDDPSFPSGLVGRARAGAARLEAEAVDPRDVRHAALIVEARARLDLDAPTASRWPGLTYVKQGVKRLVHWYLRYVAAQLMALGDATARLGLTVAAKVDGLEAEVADLRARLDALEAHRPDQ